MKTIPARIKLAVVGLCAMWSFCPEGIGYRALAISATGIVVLFAYHEGGKDPYRSANDNSGALFGFSSLGHEAKMNLARVAFLIALFFSVRGLAQWMAA